MVHDGDLIGDLHRLLLIVGDEQRRHVHDVVEPREPFAELGADAGIESPERLVEEQNLGLWCESACEAHALALAARQL